MGVLTLENIILIVSILNLIIVLLVFLKAAKFVSNSSQLEQLERKVEIAERMLREELQFCRNEIGSSARQNREELAVTLKSFRDSLSKQIMDMTLLQKTQLDTLTNSNEQKADKMRNSMEEKLEKLLQSSEKQLTQMRETLEIKLKELQTDNTEKLEKIRVTVEEKLHDTLERRLGESFKQVSERLEQVHKGLGEMQTLAAGVGDLKKALTNVKVRGTLGEIQLGNILQEIFTPEQYAENVAVKPGNRVEFAVKMPGKNEKDIWLPIDSKFPLEDYQRLLDAYDAADKEQAEAYAKQLENSIKKCAKDIYNKYIDPPATTDFAIMFLPFEGLYAEVLRRNGLFESLMRDFKVAVTGSTTLAAFLNSLQMGFRTLTIEKRTSEVWSLLGKIKTEFGRFGLLLEKTKKKLQEASNTIETASRKSRTIENKLDKVQELPDLKGERTLLPTKGKENIS